MKKIIIAGSRGFNFPDVMEFYVNDIIERESWESEHIEIVSGTAKGADRLGEELAQYYDYRLKRMPADWDKYHKAAGYIRNKHMAEYADAAIIFWDGKSKGTAHMIKLARDTNLPTFVFQYSLD